MFLKFFKYIFYFFIFYLLVGFFVLPFIVKPEIIKNIEQNTKTKASIGKVAFNPLICQLEIDNFTLKDLQKKDLLSFRKLTINLDPSALFMGAFELRLLALDDPKVYLLYTKEKKLNFLEILKEQKRKSSESKSKKSSLPHIIVDRIKLEGGELFFSDLSKRKAFHFLLNNMGLSLEDFDTKKLQKRAAKVHFYSNIGDGGLIDLKTEIHRIDPLQLDGSLLFNASRLYTEWRYVQDLLALEVADGKLSFESSYSFDAADTKRTKIEISELDLEKLRIKAKEQKGDLLHLHRFFLKNVTVMPFRHQIDVKKVGIDGLHLWAKRNPNGSINWVEYVKIKADPKEKSSVKKEKQKSPKNKAWHLLLEDIGLENMAFDFDDKRVSPAVVSKLNDFNLYAKNVTLLGEKPFTYEIRTVVNKGGKCQIEGSVVHKVLDLQTEIACKQLDITHYKPYIDQAAKQQLKRYDLNLKGALANLDIKGNLRDINGSYQLRLKESSASIDHLKIDQKSRNSRILSFKKFAFSNLALNTKSKEVNIGKVELDQFAFYLIRKKNNHLNIENLVVPKKEKPQRKKRKNSSKTAPAYHLHIDTIALVNSKLLFVDKKLAKTQRERIDRINFRVKDFDSKRGSWLHYKSSLRINKKGMLYTNGKLRHTPLKQSGRVRLERLSLRPLTPYLAEKSYLQIDDGRLSLNLYESYQKSKKYPDVRMRGSVVLNSLFVTNTNDANSSLFSLNELKVKPFTLELFPNRLYVDSLDIDSFYVSAKIDENKTINFAKLMKESGSQESASKEKQKAAKESKTNKEKKSDPFPVKIVKVNVKNGSAEFQDYSLPIKFRTNIHDLNGALYAISSKPGDTTYVDINGEVDKYGSTKLKGSVDSFNPKEYTDLDFNFKNLDLHSMSGYSASFAGYEIDSGKLYLNLGYEILHGKLNATNNIMIKKIKLGKELEGENINHLPLGFVIGLLEDSDGIIDIDMPIKGDVNNPDFKYGALVWKTFGNLIAKAVTSPFKFLGSMMGLNGEDLEFVAFEFGKSNLTPPQREKLDKIAKMMQKRPKIKLRVDEVYDEEGDLHALQLQKLVKVVMQRSGDENIKNSKTALNVDLLEDLYSEVGKAKKLDRIKSMLRKKYSDTKEFKRAYQNALIHLCTTMQDVKKSELLLLAKRRAIMIKSYLVNDLGFSAKRVLIGKAESVKEKEKVVKVALNIEVQSGDK